MSEQLRDIKGVIYVFDWGMALFFIVLAALISVLAYWLFKYIKLRRLSKLDQKEAVVPRKPADQAALEALSAFDPAEYYDKKKIKEFYFSVTEIVRQFLSANYHIDTLDKTSLEIVEELERVERDFDKVKRIDRYFSECDLVKFAKLKPGLADMQQKKDESIKIVREYWRGI